MESVRTLGALERITSDTTVGANELESGATSKTVEGSGTRAYESCVDEECHVALALKDISVKSTAASETNNAESEESTNRTSEKGTEEYGPHVQC